MYVVVKGAATLTAAGFEVVAWNQTAAWKNYTNAMVGNYTYNVTVTDRYGATDSALVIVNQVLSADVSDHLPEYATFKAMGYGPRFFLGIVILPFYVLLMTSRKTQQALMANPLDHLTPGVRVLTIMGKKQDTGDTVRWDGTWFHRPFNFEAGDTLVPAQRTLDVCGTELGNTVKFFGGNVREHAWLWVTEFPVFEEEDFPWQSVGSPSKFGEDDYTPVTFSMVTDVGEAGKTLAYVRRRNPAIDTKLMDEYVAISTRCAHLGCPVRWVSPAQRFVCPWTEKRIAHPDAYDLDHLLPVSVYPANELWNLIPADRYFNQHVKRGRLPSSERLERAEPIIANSYAVYFKSPDLKTAIREDVRLRFRGLDIDRLPPRDQGRHRSPGRCR